MKPQELKAIIRRRINFKQINKNISEINLHYDGLNMTGYNDFENFELISRFKDLMFKDTDNQNCKAVIPRFHKGTCTFVKTNCNEYTDTLATIVETDLYSEDTETLLFKLINHNNPTLLNKDVNACPDCEFIFGNENCDFCKEFLK